MARFSTLLFLVLLICVTMVIAQTGSPRQPAVPIGVGSVEMGPGVFDVNGNVDTFIETGSTSPLCLATFNESNFAGQETPIFCNQRDFEGKHGIRVSFGFPFGTPPPSDFVLSMTVYQPGAHGYESPVLYTGP